jgi:MFS family permease
MTGENFVIANCGQIGPCIGGIIVTFAQWRIIYWLQFGMTLLGLILSLLFVPSIQEKKQVMDLDKRRGFCEVVSMFNPLRIFRHFIHPNVFLAVSMLH